MRTRLDHLVTSALQQGSAVPAFTCYDFTTALAVVGAAEESGRGVILLVAPKTAATPNGLRLIAALRGLADAASVPVAVQLDHATDIAVMADAVAAGADSVLADGSSLPYGENIAWWWPPGNCWQPTGIPMWCWKPNSAAWPATRTAPSRPTNLQTSPALPWQG